MVWKVSTVTVQNHSWKEKKKIQKKKKHLLSIMKNKQQISLTRNKSYSFAVFMMHWIRVFLLQNWNQSEKMRALDDLIERCEPSQVRHIMSIIEPQFQRDFISLLPREVRHFLIISKDHLKNNKHSSEEKNKIIWAISFFLMHHWSYENVFGAC